MCIWGMIKQAYSYKSISYNMQEYSRKFRALKVIMSNKNDIKISYTQTIVVLRHQLVIVFFPIVPPIIPAQISSVQSF